MRLTAITAIACPSGNGITLSWTNPDPAGFPGIRVVRRQKTFPVSPTDGVVVAHGINLQTGFTAEGQALHAVTDQGLQGENHYYYTLFPYQGDPPLYAFDSHNRCLAMATAPHGFGARMFDQLPRIYHRYDTVGTDDPDVPAGLSQAGQLRRFLEAPGSMLDLLYSHAGAALNLHNTERMDGRLLPLLAQWIGWRIDYRLEIDAQRNEISHAPHLYKTVGLIPTVEATVKRLTNWESRIKEFVHNIFLSNNPERLNLWNLTLDDAGQWQEGETPFSLHFAYEGRVAAITDTTTGEVRLFYHALRKNCWDIWCKTWSAADGWSQSCALSDGSAIDKHPAAALLGNTLWLFWSSHDQQTGAWSILYRQRSGSGWSAATPFGPVTSQRRSPAATIDGSGGLWLFWLEQEDGRWRMKYNRYDGAAWQLAAPALFPQEAGFDARVESEPVVLSFISGGVERLLVLWSRQEPAALPGQTRWTVACRIKASLDPLTSADWGPILLKPKDTPDISDSDPFAQIEPDGSVEIFFSSDQGGSWSLWRTGLDTISHTWAAAGQISRSPYTERYPLPLSVNGGRVLLYRSNRNLTYSSEVYKATRTMDLRHAGSVTCMAANIAKNGLRNTFTDFQAYTHDAGSGGKMTDSNWYSRQTIGIYLTPDTEDPTLILRNQKLLRGVLHQFLPIQVRYVFIIEPAVYKEQIYTYDFPTAENARFIEEKYTDSLTTVSSETYTGPADSYADRIPQWRWLRSRSTGQTEGASVDFVATPVSTRFRTWHVGLMEGEE
ncbi:MAG: hypothetical protein HY885_16455 [Deltaproteobacteria bacterium]|nr:hypothetical protein [Deltaproteobacteria bacterium]